MISRSAPGTVPPMDIGDRTDLISRLIAIGVGAAALTASAHGAIRAAAAGVSLATTLGVAALALR